jgi:signal transduction histidine kinase/HPt (histidine-containing phosphotransfer) domain-containing protein
LSRAVPADGVLAAVLGALRPAAAVLDASTGRVVAVNGAWEADERPGLPFGRSYSAGCDYAQACRSTLPVELTTRVIDALVDVLDGSHARRRVEYGCRLGTERCDFEMEVSAFTLDVRRHALVLHGACDSRRGELLEDRNQALETMRLKAEFVANVSHEIRTPMNGILGMTELALETDVTDEQREYLLAVKSSAHALLALLNDVLDFSKIEGGRLRPDRIPFDVRECLAETIEPLAVRAHGKRLALVHEIAPDVPRVLIGDPGRLRQILVNLIDNAIKFTDQGRIAVRVVAEEAREDEVVLRFSVSDTGIGIEANKHELIFDPFAQADGSTTRRYGGAGLGLAISRRLAGMLGGRIRVESERGRGSTFTFTAAFRPATERAAAAVDELRLREQVAGDLGLLEEILGMFQDEGRRLLHTLAEAIDRRDAGGVERAAHKMKGTFGSLAAPQAADVASRLESMGRAGDLLDARRELVILQELAGRVERELEGIVASGFEERRP